MSQTLKAARRGMMRAALHAPAVREHAKTVDDGAAVFAVLSAIDHLSALGVEHEELLIRLRAWRDGLREGSSTTGRLIAAEIERRFPEAFDTTDDPA